jgi:hypothetical protein
LRDIRVKKTVMDKILGEGFVLGLLEEGEIYGKWMMII